MRLAALIFAALMPLAAAAQETAARGSGAVLRGVEKISGEIVDITLRAGEQTVFGPLTIELAQCRYPQGNPAGDAFAFLTIRDEGQEAPIFSGWMIASSPALNALDHPRYDLWVLRCKTD